MIARNADGGLFTKHSENLQGGEMAYKDDLQKYYVGFYGHPADPEGLEYWNKVLEGLDGDEDVGFCDWFAMSKE